MLSQVLICFGIIPRKAYFITVQHCYYFVKLTNLDGYYMNAV